MEFASDFQSSSLTVAFVFDLPPLVTVVELIFVVSRFT